ncbi:MAG: hypothetical protein ABSE87_16220 [Terracidiphilus sp.]|jgi:hypothetical protein
MSQKGNSKLVEALCDKTLVKFWNPYDSGSTQGYVLDIGPHFFLLGLIGGEIRFNGFQCLRLSDVRRLQVPDPYSDFIVAALRKRGESIKRKPNINLQSLPELLWSANRLFPLVTIHRERVKPDTCEIGRVIDIGKAQVSLLEIGPDAVWEEEPTDIPLREITRVDFGGGYEDALQLVGGNPPRSRVRRRN